MDRWLSGFVLVMATGFSWTASTSRRFPTTVPTTTGMSSATTDSFMDSLILSTTDSTTESLVERMNPSTTTTATDTWMLSVTTTTEPAVDQLQAIKDSMLTGVTAIRDSIVGLVAFLIGGARDVVERQVGRVVNAVERVGNKTILIKDNLASAGGAIVHTWGHSVRETGNITGQLVNSLTDNKRLR